MRNGTKFHVRRGLLASRGRSGLLRSREGLAALEFALIAPLLVTMVAGLYDLTTAFIAWRIFILGSGLPRGRELNGAADCAGQRAPHKKRKAGRDLRRL